jgi:type IV pilus assembly protein PilQ
MNNKLFNIIFVFSILVLFLTGCTQSGKFGKKTFKHNTPLIKDDVRKTGKIEVDKTVAMGPMPVEGDIEKLEKRKQLSSVKARNYLLIPEEYVYLKQNVSFKFQNLDYKEAIGLMAKIGDVNILVGEEVASAISAELNNVPWDKAFNALLDMKNFAADIDVANNIIRVHSPSVLTSQESYKSARASAVKRKVELEDSVEPIISEIFRLYYIAPAEAKATLIELFTSTGGNSSYIPIQVTEEKTTRSIIVRGKEKDLDVVDKVIREIDVRTKQVLIEVFIVEATSTFEKALGTKLGGVYKRQQEQIGGAVGGSSASSGITNTTAAIGGAQDLFTNFGAAGSTSGIGILKRTGSAVLKIQLEALEAEGYGKTISNPKIFTIDNQLATITQGEQIAVTTSTGTGTSSTEFKDAALKLHVTPSIIGDGNILLDITVNNDTPNRTTAAVGINKMEIKTKLLIADGDIVVIGGIKKNQVANSKNQAPGIGDLPVVGNLFKGKAKSDTMTELLIFIAPRVL